MCTAAYREALTRDLAARASAAISSGRARAAAPAEIVQCGPEVVGSRIHRVERQPLIRPGRELAAAPQDSVPAGPVDSPPAAGQPVQVLVAALDLDEPQL